MSSQVNSPLQSAVPQSLTPSEVNAPASSSCSRKISNAARNVLVAIACYALAVVCYALTGSQILLAIIAGVSLSLLLSAVCALAFAAKAPQVEQQGEAKGPGGVPEDPQDPSFPDPETPDQDPDLPPVQPQVAIPLGAPQPQSAPESEPKVESKPEPESKVESKPESKPEQKPEEVDPSKADGVNNAGASDSEKANSNSDDGSDSDDENWLKPDCNPCSLCEKLFG